MKDKQTYIKDGGFLLQTPRTGGKSPRGGVESPGHQTYLDGTKGRGLGLGTIVHTTEGPA